MKKSCSYELKPLKGLEIFRKNMYHRVLGKISLTNLMRNLTFFKGEDHTNLYICFVWVEKNFLDLWKCVSI